MIDSNAFFRFGAWARVALLTCSLVSFGFCQEKSGSPAVAQPSPSTEAAQLESPEAKAVFIVRGIVKAGNTPLPGATVTASNTLTGKKTSAATNIDGSYSLTLPSRGRYVVKAELAAFAPSTKEVLITPAARQATVDADLMLASRAQILAAQQQQQSAGATQQIVAALANRGMQSLSLSGETTNAGESGDTAGAQNPGGLPLNGAGAEGPTESVAITGAMGQAQNFGMNPDEIQDRIQEFRERAQREGGAPGGGGVAMVVRGGGGGFGGPGVFVLGGRAGKFNINQPHGSLFYTAGNSIFDAKPFSLTGDFTPKPSYDQNRFGAVIGSPLVIPHVIKSDKTFVFGGWTGNRNTTPYDQFSTVPTLEERAGRFSGVTLPNGAPVQLLDPVTGRPFANNTLTSISPAAQELMKFIPLPNLPGTRQNFHFVSSLDQNQDQIFARVIHNFGEGSTAFMPFGGGGRGGGRGTRNNINFNLNYSDSHAQTSNPFPALLGVSQVSGVTTGAGWVVSKGKLTNNLRFNYNRSHTELDNQYQDKQNVAAEAGVGGVSQNPFDFGVPALSFNDFQSVRDAPAQLSTNQTFSFSESVIWRLKKHNLRFGGDFRRLYNDLRSDQNARGSFTFTGFATGFDFADFLLGLPQLASVQAGSTTYDFRANSWDLFVQDDWRLSGNLSLNLGLRYEYVSPFSEAHDQLVNLDINSGITAVAPVFPGSNGPFTGGFPVTVVEPDRNNFAPRIGIAWKPTKKTVVRAGYGINYNTTQYGAIVQNLALQPPFAFTETNVSSAAKLLTLANSFSAISVPGVTNNFAVDKNYKLGNVQIWNLDIQRELTPSLLLNVAYNGSKGTDLDIQRAPNRLPDGTLRIPGVQPFILETSQGDSIFHSGSVRLRKRLRHGMSASGSYMFSKSIDNASSIGGGAVVAAQNDLDLAAERGLSSFDQRHRLTGNFLVELPFGTGKKWLNRGGALGDIFGDWQWSGDFTMASGLPFTPRILGAFTDVAQGVNGTLRADLTGAPITLANPTVLDWFNPAAFVAPPLGQFGGAGRNIINGPGQLSFDMAVSKTLLVRDTRALELRLAANNVFNRPQFTAIDTVLNSPTFGQVISVAAMRRVTLTARCRF